VVLHLLPLLLATNSRYWGGNFVLGRTSAALARLGDGEVTELIASVISNLVEGEILQMKEIKMEKEKASRMRMFMTNLPRKHVHRRRQIQVAERRGIFTSRRLTSRKLVSWPKVLVLRWF
jgi:hypothetical protein